MKSRQFEAEYRISLSRKLDYLVLFGADLSPQSRRQKLSVAYISLTLSKKPGSDEVTHLLPVESVLQSLSPKDGRLLIRGEAGSGKSTLFRWTAMEAAGAFERQQTLERIHQVAPTSHIPEPEEKAFRISWRSKVPFLIRLRECEKGHLPSPDKFPEMILKEIARPAMGEWVLSTLKAGRGLVLFDGVDELPKLDRLRFEKEIRDIMAVYPDNYFIVSTRPEAVPKNWLEEEGFREAWLNPMSDSDQGKFIDKWHEAVASELRRLDLPGEDLNRLAANLKQQLAAQPGVSRLACNPLLCAMICALHRDSHQKLPETIAQLCESICHMLLYLRDWERRVSELFPRPYRRLTYDQKKAIVSEIAQSMLLNEESFTFARTVEKIAGVLRFFPKHAKDDAEEICHSLIERSGMLREVRPGYVDFIHDTIKEYLAGSRFADTGDAGFLAQQAAKPAWQRVILFSVTTSRPGFASELIVRLLKDNPGRARKLLAMRCWGAALLVNPEMVGRSIDELIEELSPPQNMAEAEAFAGLGNLAVPALRRREGLEVSEAAACVRALRLIATDLARDAMSGYENEKREEVIAELAFAFNPLSIRWYRERYVLDGEPLPSIIAKRIHDLAPLAWLKEVKPIFSVNLSGAKIKEIDVIGGMTRIEKLNLAGTKVKDLSPLAALAGLRELDLSGTPVVDISPLSELAELRRLDLSGSHVTNLSPLARLVNLEWLDLVQTSVRDLRPLANLANLKFIDIRSTDVKDISPVKRAGVKVEGPS